MLANPSGSLDGESNYCPSRPFPQSRGKACVEAWFFMRVLEVTSLGKRYTLYDSPAARMKALLTGREAGRTHWALADVSFSLKRGQCLGVVGDNGAGKSTLLKLVTGTLQPTTGHIVREGRLTAILELGAGFHPEFTGRENLFFAGALIGIPEPKMKDLAPEIIAFAELESSIDWPVKTFSSGMVVRLAFALVTALEPDILVIDEALAVGDQHFQRKCLERIQAFRERGCTILFCSHSLYHVRQLCDLAVWLDHGRMRACGYTEIVLAGYEMHIRHQNAGEHGGLSAAAAPVPRVAQRGDLAKLMSVEVSGLGESLGAGAPPLLKAADLSVTVTAQMPDGEQPHLAVMLERADKVCITAVGTHADGVKPVCLGDGLWRSTVVFPGLPLYSGEYMVSAFLFDTTGTLVYEQWLDCKRFMVVFPTLEVGLVRLPHTWS
jgi:lipopolysaccharide transport system ATP-binding protein